MTTNIISFGQPMSMHIAGFFISKFLKNFGLSILVILGMEIYIQKLINSKSLLIIFLNIYN